MDTNNHHKPVQPTEAEMTYLERYEVVPEEGIVKFEGQNVGHLNNHGYMVISGKKTGVGNNRKKHLRSHIIWWAYYKKWPTAMLDHKDTNSLNDRIDNLRESTSRDNNANQYKDRGLPTGVLAVENRFEVRIGIEGRMRYLGSSPNADVAGKMYQFAKERLPDIDRSIPEWIKYIRDEWVAHVKKHGYDV